jgi:hypothetical protein
MYCPRCGRQPISEELRFCSYCGFKLGVVKAAVSDSEDVQPDALTAVRLPRQRDINIGVIVMFADAVFVSFMAGVTGPGIGREAAAVVLAVMYALIVLFSRPITKAILNLLSWNQSPDANFSASWRGMVFGATLMFMSTVVLAISSLLMLGRMRTPPFFIGLILSFGLLVVLGRYLMRGLQYLIADESRVSIGHADQTSELPSGLANPALPAGHDTPISIFDSPRVTTAEIVSPSSVTEHTTNLLDIK